VYKFFKCLTPLVPVILSVVLFITLTRDIISSHDPDFYIIYATSESADAQLEAHKEELKKEYSSYFEALETRFDILMAIVGIAVSVWVSLNIFTVIERHQLDATEKKLNETITKLEAAEQKLSAFEVKISEFENSQEIIHF